MTDNQVNHALKTGRLKLSPLDTFAHYAIVMCFFACPVLFVGLYLRDVIQGTSKLLSSGVLVFGWVSALLGILFYWMQRRRLKFTPVHTTLPREQLDDAIETVANALEWIPYDIQPSFIIAKTHPSFVSGSFGEQITVVFDQDRILINSICDPDKRSSIVSMGRNRRNVERLVEEVKQARR